MNHNRKRPSRFDDNMTGMSKSSRPEFGYGNDVFSSRDMGPAGMQRLPNKTPEQLAFDAEFSKWEKSFEDWKRTFANHPDRNSYFEYEKKFLDVRDKLLLKRSQIYATRPNPMDALLNAADSFANSIINKFDTVGPLSMMMMPRSGGQSMMMPRSDPMTSRSVPSLMSRSIPQSMTSRSGPIPLMSIPGPSGLSGWDLRDGRDVRDIRDVRDSRSTRDGRGQPSRPRSRDRLDDRRGGRDRDRRDDRSKSTGKGRDDRRDRDRDIRGGGGRDRGRGAGRDRGRGGGGGGRNDRRSDSNKGGRGKPDSSRGGRGERDRQPAKSMRKPSQKDVDKELARNDVYPLNRWLYCSNVERPALVGKRAKKKNAKILKVIDRKRRIAAGEIIPEEVAVVQPQGQEKFKRQVPNDAPLKERIEKLFEEARKADLPKMLPGSGKRRLKNIRAKPERQWDEDERSFIALATFIQEKRSQYLMKKKAEAGESAQGEIYDPAAAT